MNANPILSRAILFVLFALAAAAQDDPAGVAAFARLKTAVNQATLASQSFPDNIRADVNNYLVESGNLASSLWERYQGSLNRVDRSKISRVYVVSLNSDSLALEKLPAVAPGSRAAVARDVRDDLQVKSRFSSESLGIGGAFPSVVTVTVETERNGKKVDNLWVRCNPQRDGVTKNPMFVFNSATSPTVSQLPPGVFTIWVEATSGGQVLTQEPIMVGSNGSDHDTIRLALP